MTRIFEKQVFMGSGEGSVTQMGHLYCMLSKALDIIHRIQQEPCGSEQEKMCPNWRQEQIDGQIEVNRLAEEIFTGLTGRKVRFKNEICSTYGTMNFDILRELPVKTRQ